MNKVTPIKISNNELEDNIYEIIKNSIEKNDLSSTELSDLRDDCIFEYIHTVLTCVYENKFTMNKIEKITIKQFLKIKSEIENNTPEIEDNTPEIEDNTPEIEDNTPEIEDKISKTNSKNDIELDLSTAIKNMKLDDKDTETKIIHINKTKQDNFINNKTVIVKKIENNSTTEKQNDVKLREEAHIYQTQNKELIVNRLKKLIEINKNLPLQRSKEWYEYRHDMITASDLLNATNTNASKRNIIIKKASPIDTSPQSSSGKACLHGKIFEPIATQLYEIKNNTKILEFGCIPHDNKKFHFGASPDGICSFDNDKYVGRMLEIKCPFSRVIEFGKIKEEYRQQMQGQMEVCDMEYCDFLECKIDKYACESEFYKDGDEYKTEDGMEKGIILTYLNELNETKYIYPEKIGMNKEELYRWIETKKEEINKQIKNNNDKNDTIRDDSDTEDELDNINYGIIWWKIKVYSCILVKRDREWFANIKPQIDDIWNEIEKRRITGIKDLESQIKRKKKQDKTFNECMID